MQSTLSYLCADTKKASLSVTLSVVLKVCLYMLAKHSLIFYAIFLLVILNEESIL